MRQISDSFIRCHTACVSTGPSKPRVGGSRPSGRATSLASWPPSAGFSSTRVSLPSPLRWTRLPERVNSRHNSADLRLPSKGTRARRPGRAGTQFMIMWERQRCSASYSGWCRSPNDRRRIRHMVVTRIRRPPGRLHTVAIHAVGGLSHAASADGPRTPLSRVVAGHRTLSSLAPSRQLCSVRPQSNSTVGPPEDGHYVHTTESRI
jgi:hypothetical protein